MSSNRNKRTSIKTERGEANLMDKIKKYLWNIAISFDQFINTLFGGDMDETISSRMGKHLVKHDRCPFCLFLCKLLNYIQKDHCVKAIEVDEGKDQVTKL